MSARRRGRRDGARGPAVIAAWLLLLLASLSFVTWRQTRGVEMEKALRALEAERGVAEAERIAAVRRIEELRSRSRILAVARERFGMRLPEDHEIVFIRVEPTAPGASP
jgi:hypothetical protein